MTDCVREAFFFFLFFLSECEVTQEVSASRYVYAPYHLPQDYLTHRRDRNLPVSQWSHRAIVAFTSSPNISSVLPLDLKEAFQDRMAAKATPCPGEERWL